MAKLGVFPLFADVGVAVGDLVRLGQQLFGVLITFVVEVDLGKFQVGGQVLGFVLDLLQQLLFEGRLLLLLGLGPELTRVSSSASNSPRERAFCTVSTAIARLASSSFGQSLLHPVPEDDGLIDQPPLGQCDGVEAIAGRDPSGLPISADWR